MPTFEPKDIRNVILLGHSGSGKTSLAEAILFGGGAISKMGNVGEGNTASDYNEDEKERKCSLSSSLLSFVSGGIKVNMIDTPGYTDFVGEIVGGLRAVEANVVVVNATGGVEFGTERGHKMSKEKGVASLFFINKLDKEYADFDHCVEAIRKRFGKNCVPLAYPIGKESSFSGVVSLLNRQGMDKLSEEEKAKSKFALDLLSEAVAETDDVLLEKYLEKGELSADEIKGALRKAFAEGKLIPILCGSSTGDIGVKELIDVIVNHLPSPADRPKCEATNPANSEKVELEMNPSGPFAALVFKTLSDPYLGQISIFKVFSGKLQTNSGFYNVTKGAREKSGPLFTLVGKAQTSLESIQAGDIGCMAKLKETDTDDSLGDEKNPLKLDEIRFPEPAISYSLKPKTRMDEEKISTALHKLVAEDPTFKTTRDEQTKELIVSGMGDMHIGMMINRMKVRYGVAVDMGTPKVAYKETILGKGGSQYRHKKQTGGAGQFAEVWMRIEPLPRGGGFEFADEIKGGSIPGPFIVSCEKGVRGALQSGVLAGFPVVDVRAIIYDGKTHPVDSKDIAFQIAGRRAFKECMQKARPVILEPIMDVEFVVPEEFMGDIAGSLNQRRGRVMGMEAGDGSQTIKAKVPLDEMYKYVNEMKSITGGRGTYTMTFSHYEIVPSHLAQGIVDVAKQTKAEEAEA
ncbi:MAG: elongation factor G [Elusimicrobia bacterium]|nr:elongation factor G [Elusimicrobiota bacterium]